MSPEISIPEIRTPFLLRGAPALGRISLLQLAALTPPVAARLAEDPAAQASVLATALMVTLVWENLFAFIRGRSPSWHGAVTAMIVAVMVPASVPLWQMALALSFGVVMGELVFGGRGFAFLNPAVATLAFLVFSFPASALAGANVTLALATVPGMLLLFLSGLIPWRVFAAAITAYALMSLAGGGLPDPAASATALAFGLVFFLCDPLSTASSNGGRWAIGLLGGALTALFDKQAGTQVSPSALVFAALLCSIFAPLADHVAAIVHARTRRTRRG